MTAKLSLVGPFDPSFSSVSLRTHSLLCAEAFQFYPKLAQWNAFLPNRDENDAPKILLHLCYWIQTRFAQALHVLRTTPRSFSPSWITQVGALSLLGRFDPSFSSISLRTHSVVCAYACRFYPNVLSRTLTYQIAMRTLRTMHPRCFCMVLLDSDTFSS